MWESFFEFLFEVRFIGHIFCYTQSIKTKEVHSMNASRAYRTHRTVRACRYPNAASRTYLIDRFLDRLLCSAAWIGVVVMVLFLAVL